MDLSKLTPAPWRCCLAASGNGGNHPYLYPPGQPYDVAQANAEFIELARQAFEVMMRRGWGYTKYSDTEFGISQSTLDRLWWANHGIEQMRFIRNLVCDNPFAVLVEADKWYRANVEKGQV